MKKLALVNFAFMLLYGFSIFEFSLHNISAAHAFTLLFAAILSSSYFLIGWALLSRSPVLLKWARRCNYFLIAFGVLEIITFIAISILSALLVGAFIFLPLFYNFKALKHVSTLAAL